MSDRDTERQTAPPSSDDSASFLVRWSRRKRANAAGEPLPEPVVAKPVPAIDGTREDVPLADPVLLNFADDFTPYLKARVAPALKKAALKKLFSDPSFNEIDGLDVYLEDFNKVPDLPAADLALLTHAKEVLWPGRTAADDATAPAEKGVGSMNAPAVEQANAPPGPPSAANDEAHIAASDESASRDDTGRHRDVDS